MIQHIIQKIDEAKKKVEELSKSKMEILNKVVLKYVKKYECIVYGGTAIHMHLTHTKGSPAPEGIYPPGKIFDYDVFHWDHIGIAMEIADEFKKMGFGYVRCVRGMHSTTYKIFVEFQSVMDISYIPKDYYKMMLKKWSVKYNDAWYLSPTYIFRDHYKIISTNFIADSFRMSKVKKRIELLEKLPPIVRVKGGKIVDLELSDPIARENVERGGGFDEEFLSFLKDVRQGDKGKMIIQDVDIADTDTRSTVSEAQESYTDEKFIQRMIDLDSELMKKEGLGRVKSTDLSDIPDFDLLKEKNTEKNDEKIDVDMEDTVNNTPESGFSDMDYDSDITQQSSPPIQKQMAGDEKSLVPSEKNIPKIDNPDEIPLHRGVESMKIEKNDETDSSMVNPEEKSINATESPAKRHDIITPYTQKEPTDVQLSETKKNNPDNQHTSQDVDIVKGGKKISELKFKEYEIFVINVDDCIEMLSYKPYETIKRIIGNKKNIMVQKITYPFLHSFNIFYELYEETLGGKTYTPQEFCSSDIGEVENLTGGSYFPDEIGGLSHVSKKKSHGRKSNPKNKHKNTRTSKKSHKQKTKNDVSIDSASKKIHKKGESKTKKDKKTSSSIPDTNSVQMRPFCRIFRMDMSISCIKENFQIGGWNFVSRASNDLTLAHLYARLWNINDVNSEKMIDKINEIKKLGHDNLSDINLYFDIEYERDRDTKIIPSPYAYVPGVEKKQREYVEYNRFSKQISIDKE